MMRNVPTLNREIPLKQLALKNADVKEERMCKKPPSKREKEFSALQIGSIKTTTPNSSRIVSKNSKKVHAKKNVRFLIASKEKELQQKEQVQQTALKKNRIELRSKRRPIRVK